MDILTLILSCSITLSIDDKLIESIIEIESFSNSNYVRPANSKYGVGYETIDDAKKAIHDITNNGENAYIGLMGLPYMETLEIESNIDNILDDCKNIQLGTAIIDTFNQQCFAEGKKDLTTCILNKYATFTGKKRNKFTSKVIYNGIKLSSKNNKNKIRNKISNSSILMKKLDSNNSKGNTNDLFIEMDLNTNK